MGRLQYKVGRPSNYRKKLKSDDWTVIKKKVRLRDDFKCRCCGSMIRLETHHITYYVNGQSIVGNETEHLNWLITVCEDCHQRIHSDIRHKYNPKNPFKSDANTR